jgi:3-oxoacyl-[acyl-carrier-protein] synthase-3
VGAKEAAVLRTHILGMGKALPDRVVTNDELAQRMTTSHAWIEQRTGICERRYVDFDQDPMGSAELGARAAAQAMANAPGAPQDIDCIILATLSPDRHFPGDGVSVQVKLGIPAGVPAFDVRNQCSGFLYGLTMADAFIRAGTFGKVLLIGAEVHSTGLDFSDRGRDVAVLFGDGAGAVVLGGQPGQDRGLLGINIHSDGRYIDALKTEYPSSARMPRITEQDVAQGLHYPTMQGREVFKHAVVRMPEVLVETLKQQGMTPDDIDLLIVHQANLRIAEAVAKRLNVPEAKMFNNIMRYGNTTAGSIPIALCEAWEAGRLQEGSVLALAAFGAGFTWGAAVLRWGRS